jgi:hypothetical protein
MKKRMKVVWIALLLLLGSWVFPYWVSDKHATLEYHSDGFYFLFDQWNVNKHIDFTRLLFVDLVIIDLVADASLSLSASARARAGVIAAAFPRTHARK